MSRTTETALKWFDRGITPLPLYHNTKIASIKWKRWQDDKPPRGLVMAWFAGGDCNVGLMVGPVSNGLVALDFDSLPEYFRWRRIHKYNLANSYTVRTPRPGRHVYLYADEPPDRTFSLQNVDVKCSGYITCPPSEHPSGVAYEVYQDSEILRTTTLDLAVVGLERRPNKPNIKGGQANSVTVNIAGSLVVNQPTINIRSFGTQDNLNSIKLPRNVAYQIKQRFSILGLASQFTEMRPSDDEGNWYIGRCPHPGHEDRNPSFSLSLRNQRANCRTPTCALHNKNGLDVIDLVGILHGVKPRQAMAMLAVKLGLVGKTG